MKRTALKSSKFLLSLSLSLSLVFSLWAFALPAFAGTTSDGKSTLSWDDNSKTLTVGAGVLADDDLMDFIGEKATPTSKRAQLKNVIIEGDVVLEPESSSSANSQGNAVGFFGFAYAYDLVRVETKGKVTMGKIEDRQGNYLFNDCTSLEYLDLSNWQLPNIQETFMNCSNLKTLILSDWVIDNSLGAFAEQDEATGVIWDSTSLQDVTMPATANFSPWDNETESGSGFPWNKEGGWNAYQDGKLVANAISSYEEARAYQESHPGMTRFVWVEAPEPGPTPDPDPQPTPTPDPEPAPTPVLEDGWVQDDADWRYVVDGDYVTGWYWIDDAYGAHWYCFSETDNYLITNAWLWDGAWYWVCSSGAMIQGIWQWIDGVWYGFWWNGAMCQGWVWDADYVAWFYCYENGAMALNAWVNGYYLSDSGICLY